MPQFSIIIAVYNNEKYLPMAVESVLTQDYIDFELIIVDDGSTDRTREIAYSIANDDCRVCVIHQENQWIFASYNNGINAAIGEYVFFVNSDDRLRPGSLSLMAEKIKQYHPDIIWTKILTHKCDENQKIISYDYLSQNKTIEQDLFFDNVEAVRSNWLFFYKKSLSHNQINLYKRDIMCKYKFRNDVYGSDMLFNIVIASDIKSAFILKEAVYDHFHYESEYMNASVGKYYGYEHEMFNDFYLEYIKLYTSWNRLDNEVKEFFGKLRMKYISFEISTLKYSCCRLNIDEKIQKIFGNMVDNVVYQCAKELDCIEELEARVLSGIKALLIKDNLKPESNMYFVYELLDALLRYEKDEADYQKIKDAVFHPLNKYNIGLSFYNKLQENR